MKTLIRFLSLLALIIVLFSCGKDAEIETDVSFRLKYQDAPLVMFQEYTYPDGKKMTFTRFSFFIEDFKIINEDQEAVEMVDLNYYNLADSHTSLADANIGAVIGTKTLTEGIYTVAFNIGVDPVSNAKKPVDFTSDNVLSNTAEYWHHWKSYVFAKVEGKIDLDNNGVVEEGFALHIGADLAYRTINYQGAFTVDESNNVIGIDINLEHLFEGSGGMYDIVANPQIHSPEQNEFVSELADNLATCF